MLLPIIVASSWLLVISQIAGMCVAARAADERSDVEDT
jgi:hypothetical protein